MMTTQITLGRYLLLYTYRTGCVCLAKPFRCPSTIIPGILLMIFSFTPAIVSAQDIPAPVFLNERELSSNSGYLSLNWDYSDSTDITFVLEASRDSLFKDADILYEGPDRATFISGLEDGKYFYRLRAFDGNQYSAWSGVTRVLIKHHSLSFALFLFGVGMLVFAATVGIIIYGNRQVETLNPSSAS